MFEFITISNFKSCGEPVTLDFRAGKSNLYANNLYVNPHVKKSPRITKYNLAFGPNGSGKSNIIEAVAFFRFVIVHRVPQKGISELSNAFCKESLGDIGAFSTSFFVSNIPERISYSIKVDFHQHKLVEERLEIGKNKVFSWTTDEDGFPLVDVSFKSFSSKNDKDIISTRCEEYAGVKSQSVSLLSWLCSLQKDASKANNVDKFFRDILSPFANLVVLTPSPTSYEDLKDVFTGEGADIERIMQELKNLGITAKSIHLEKVSKERFAEDNGWEMKYLEEMITVLKKDLEPGTKRHFFLADQPYYYGIEDDQLVFYAILLDYGNGVKLRLESESSGNQKIINLVPVLFGTSAKDDALILIDELDRSLHTILARKLVKDIIEKNIANNKQFFLTAHDPNLLDTNLFRKDELFFINIADHSSSIQKLGDTGIRIDRDIKKKFIGGKL